MAGRGNELISNLAKKPLGYKLGVLLGVLAVFGFVYWQFFHSTLSDERDMLVRERAKLTDQEKKLKARKEERDVMRRERDLLVEQLKKLDVALPSSSELPAFFVRLQKQAAAAGVTVRKWSRRKEAAVETYVKVPVTMEITGTFYQILKYFKLLAETDRIITVENLSLAGAKMRDDSIMLTAKFVAATFRQKDRPPDTTIEEEEDTSGGDQPSESRFSNANKTGQPPSSGEATQPADDSSGDSGSDPGTAEAAPGAGGAQ